MQELLLDETNWTQAGIHIDGVTYRDVRSIPWARGFVETLIIAGVP